MNAFKKLARSLQGSYTEGSLQSFYGEIASRVAVGGPHYSESKRDLDAVRQNNTRYMTF